MKTVKIADVKREWHLIDATGQNLGRLSTKIAAILMGKNKAIVTPYLDAGDYVVVVNSKKVAVSGKKESQKKYYHHSQYPGGLYVKKLSDLRRDRPNEILRHAIVGMLPKTKLGKLMFKKLYLFENNEHPYTEKFKPSQPSASSQPSQSSKPSEPSQPSQPTKTKGVKEA